MEPLLRALEADGALGGVYYGSDTLGWKQLGTPPVRRGAEVLETRAARRGAIRKALGLPDGVHLLVSFANRLCFEVMAGCARERRPYFVLAESFTPRGRSLRGVIRDTVYRYLLRHASGAFAMAPKCAEDFLRVGLPRSRIFPGLYPGPERLLPHQKADGRRVVFCGRLIPIKGFDLLVEAMRALAVRGRSLDFDVIGEGPERDRCLAVLADTSVRVNLHGAVSSERVAEIVRGAGALIVPTRFWEGWGYVVNEALAQGVPVVVSDIVAAREVIVEGRSGAVFRSEDVTSLADAIERALALNADDGSLAEAIGIAQQGIDATVFVRYMLEVMAAAVTGAMPVAVPPWHASVDRLGGNPEVEWWRSFAGR
jgi:glycosyltransferase involved in cell wall biosynthesis